MPTKTAPTPQYHKFSELVIDPILSRRSPKEIRDNAKELAKDMAAFGEWDAMQPGQVFTGEDGKLHVCAGFTRIEAAKSLDLKGGYFFELEGVSQFDIEAKAITTNGGKPISRRELGGLFAKWETGVVADDFAGAVADPKEAKHWKIAPMGHDEIAMKIGKSSEYVRQCIVIASASPEIAELIETDQISHNIVIIADNWAKHDPAKALRILRAAVRAAAGEKATKKHMEAIKADFVKQKAVAGTNGAEDKGGKDEKEDREDKGGKDEKEDREDKGGKEPAELFPQQTEPKPPTKKETKGIRETLITAILKWDEDKGNLSMSDDDAGGLADALVDAGLIIARLPF
jgi:hypothetical protein